MILRPCTVKIDKIRYAADCETLVVSENRVDPASRLIALPVKRIHSASAQPAEPIFYLSGGPGSSNMKFNPPAWLLATHDVVLVGYRGVDGIPELDCPDVAKAMTGLNGDLLISASLDAMSADRLIRSSWISDSTRNGGEWRNCKLLTWWRDGGEHNKVATLSRILGNFRFLFVWACVLEK